jgi:hypothetical protein
MANNAKLYNIKVIQELLAKAMAADATTLQQNLFGYISVIDRQDAFNRYTWLGLPPGVTGEMIERVLYYKGQGALIYNEFEEKWYFLPYVLNGNIDIYGRYLGINVLPFYGNEQGDKKNQHIISDKVYIPRYDIRLDALTAQDVKDSAFLLHDYSLDISQQTTPRSVLQMPIINLMSKCLPYMNTALMNSTGVMGLRVQDGEEQSVYDASRAIENSALTGQKYVPITGALDFQELSGSNVAQAEQFLLAMQALDNFRLSGYGLGDGMLYQKKAHMLESEQSANTGNIGLIMDDGLYQRQQWANIVNSYTGFNIRCEVSEVAAGIDKNMDGEISDEPADEYNGQTPVDDAGGIE